MNHKDYYTALGQLVYSIAMADGSIQNEEVSKVFHFVVSQIVELESESGNGRDALKAFYTEKEFHRMKNENIPVDEAYQRFIVFIEKNKNDLNDKLKTTCINLMEKVAVAYNGIEDAEMAIIEKVKKRIVEL